MVLWFAGQGNQVLLDNGNHLISGKNVFLALVSLSLQFFSFNNSAVVTLVEIPTKVRPICALAVVCVQHLQ